MKEQTLQDEIRMWQVAQLEWRSAAPRAKRQFIMGNHEARWEKALWKADAFAELADLSLSKVLGLKTLGIDPEITDEIDLGPLVIRHGQIVRAQSAMSAKGEVEKQGYQVSVMTGHTHRGGTFMSTKRKNMVFGIECFCLCQLDPWYGVGPYDWQNGIVLATIHDDQSLQFEPIPFFHKDGKVVAHWRDRQYLA